MQFEHESDGLIEQWLQISGNIDTFLTKPRHTKTRVFDSIDRDINRFVALLKALAPVRSTFKTVLATYISHDEV